MKCCLPPCWCPNLERSSLLSEIYRSAAWTNSVVFAGFCARISAEMLGATSLYMSSIVTNFAHSSTDSHSFKHAIPTLVFCEILGPLSRCLWVLVQTIVRNGMLLSLPFSSTGLSSVLHRSLRALLVWTMRHLLGLLSIEF